MERILKLLGEAQYEFECVNPYGEEDVKSWTNGLRLLKGVISKIKIRPRWETYEQFLERTGKAWPDNAAVYVREIAEREEYVGWGSWVVCDFRYAKTYTYETQIVCATEAGPPPDDWMPEEA